MSAIAPWICRVWVRRNGAFQASVNGLTLFFSRSALAFDVEARVLVNAVAAAEASREVCRRVSPRRSMLLFAAREQPVSRRIVIAAVLLFVACSTTTTFTSTWKAPGTEPVSPIGRKVAAVFISPEESQRRAGENALAADLTQRGAVGISSFTVVPDRADGDAARQRLRDAGANGAVVMRIVSKDQEINYTPGMSVPASSRHFGPYWGGLVETRSGAWYLHDQHDRFSGDAGVLPGTGYAPVGKHQPQRQPEGSGCPRQGGRECDGQGNG